MRMCVCCYVYIQTYIQHTPGTARAPGLHTYIHTYSTNQPLLSFTFSTKGDRSHHSYVYTYIYICIYIYICTHVRETCKHTHTQAQTCPCWVLYVNKEIDRITVMFIRIYICIYIYMYVYIHTYIRMYVKRTNTHIRKHKPALPGSCMSTRR